MPTWAKQAGCPLRNEALGTDYEAVCRRAENILLKQLDSWRTAGRSDLVPDRTSEGSFDWLAATYKASEKYTKLSRSQRTNHDQGFGMVAGYTLRDGRRFGSLPLKSVTTDVVDRLFDKLLIVHEPVLAAVGRRRSMPRASPSRSLASGGPRSTTR